MRIPSTPLSILVVDDDRDTADSLALLLQLHGFAASASYSGAEAFDCVLEYPDAVVLDLWMPRENGWALARRFARLANPPFIIAMTGSDRDDERQRSEDAGISLHLLKPLDLDLLVASLRQIALATEQPCFFGMTLRPEVEN